MDREEITLYKTRYSAHWSPLSGEPAPTWVFWMNIIFILLGLGMLGGGFYAYWQEKQFDKIAVSTSGTVIDFAQRRGYVRNNQDSRSRAVIYYHPVVQFTDQQGKSQEFNTSEGSTSPKYRRGDKVTVLYEPDNPEFAVIDDWGRYLITMILGGIGVVFTLFGILFWWLAKKSGRQKNNE